MKINNIAIVGIFVTIFGLIETANATTIASQAYVDAKDGLKQDKLTSASGGNVSVDNTSNTAASRAVTGITATDGVLTFTTQPIAAGITASDVVENHDTSALSITNASTMTTKAPSVKAVYNMVRKSNASGGAIRSTTNAVDTVVPTEKAVATALANKVDTTALSGENVVITSDNHGIPEAGAVQSGILYMEGIGIDNITDDVSLSEAVSEKSWTTADGQDDSIKNMRSDKNMDKYIPTVAAVEARAKALEAYAVSAASTAVNGITHPITDGTNALELSDSSDHAPSVTAVKGIKQAAQTGSTVTAWDTSVSDTTSAAYTSDNKVPSVKAVAQQIAKRVTNGTNVLSLSDSSTNAPSVTAVKGMIKTGTTANTTALTTRNSSNVITSTGEDTTVPTTALLVDVLQTLDGANASGSTGVSAGASADTNKIGQPVVAVSQTDGKVTATLGTVKNAGIASDAAIDFSKMNDALNDVNTTSDASCSAVSPCILTFYKVGTTKYYKWTNMDTENTNAVPNSNS